MSRPCPVGQASIRHYLCTHGSSANLAQDPRMCVIIHYMPGGTSYRGRISPPAGKILEGRKGNRHANVPLLGPNAKAGDLFTGECFSRAWRVDPDLGRVYGVEIDLP